MILLTHSNVLKLMEQADTSSKLPRIIKCYFFGTDKKRILLSIGTSAIGKHCFFLHFFLLFNKAQNTMFECEESYRAWKQDSRATYCLYSFYPATLLQISKEECLKNQPFVLGLKEHLLIFFIIHNQLHHTINFCRGWLLRKTTMKS